MAAAYLLGRAFFRRMDILQAASLAARLILFFRADELADPSFQFSFLSIGVIGGIALPWLERTAEPLRHSLQHISDVTRDHSFTPLLAQLRLDMRAVSTSVVTVLPARLRDRAASITTAPIRATVLIRETFIISAVIQLGLTPLLVEDFHRVAIVGLFANIPAVLLTGIIVPFGIAAVGISFVSQVIGHLLARFTDTAVSFLLKVVTWFATSRSVNFRVPGFPIWLLVTFGATLILLAVAARERLRFAQ